MDDPPLFKRLSLLYFAAASFSETVRRLGRPELAPGFLLCAHPAFGPELAACASLAAAAPRGSARRALEARIDRAIEPFDTAGLLDRGRRDWYPVVAADLLASADKLAPRRRRYVVFSSAAAWCRRQERPQAARRASESGNSSKEPSMSEREVLANQAKILRNQETLLRNQKKLDRVLAIRSGSRPTRPDPREPGEDLAR